jgi:hypothetical protein
MERVHHPLMTRYRVRLAALITALLATVGLTFTAAPAMAATVTNFWIHCTPVSGAVGTYDPIVAKGSTSTDHYHVFFGNTGINPNSTPSTLQAAGIGATTCTTSTDTAAYWAPQLELEPGLTQTYSPSNYACFTLSNGNEACSYTGIRAYYSLANASRSAITNIPFGMEVIGGSSIATGPGNHVSYACGGSTTFETYPYDCSPYLDPTPGAFQDGVVIRVDMPRCWNGADPTQRANFSYPSSGITCPSGFPKLLPLVNLRFHTGIVDPCGDGVSCPQGAANIPLFGFRNADNSLKPWYQAHADFMNGWQQGDHGTSDNLGGLDDLVHDCLQLAGSCPANPRTQGGANMPT